MSLGSISGKKVDVYNKMVERLIMSLNLKDPETVHMIRELAAMTGENLTTAVRVAVKERMERIPEKRVGLAKWIMSIARETAPMMDDGRSSREIMDALYDPQTGLPL